MRERLSLVYGTLWRRAGTLDYEIRRTAAAFLFLAALSFGVCAACPSLGQRLAEVKRLGFTKCMIPKRAQGKLAVPEGLELIRVANIREAMAALL